MKWALVPEREGRYRIPPLAMSYFDAAAGRYKTLKTAEVTLAVAPGGTDRAMSTPARPAGANTEPQARKTVTELGNDILPVHAAIGGPASGLSALPGGVVFWMLLFGPPAAFAMTLGGVVVRRSSGSLTAAMSVRNAAAGFIRTCKNSGLTEGELMQALQEYLSRRLSLVRGSRTADEAGKGSETTGSGEALARLVARIEKDLR